MPYNVGDRVRIVPADELAQYRWVTSDMWEAAGKEATIISNIMHHYYQLAIDGDTTNSLIHYMWHVDGLIKVTTNDLIINIVRALRDICQQYNVALKGEVIGLVDFGTINAESILPMDDEYVNGGEVPCHQPKLILLES